MKLVIDGQNLSLSALMTCAFHAGPRDVEIPESCLKRVNRAHQGLMRILENKVPVYGVTTGFGDSGSRTISFHQSEELQHNLVSYLLCGSGPLLAPEVGRAILAIRLNSLCRGLSGVSVELIERLRLHLQNDWAPVIPREGSLGASGDLVPLAYLARNIEGEGEVYSGGQVMQMADVLKAEGLQPYRLKAKEGLAIVNGTSAMAGLFAVNLQLARFLLERVCLHSAWLTLALKGRTEAFGTLVNERAKSASGQAAVAARVRSYLDAENYKSKPLSEIRIEGARTEEWVQDRYSLRCVPQIAGPVQDTITLLEGWLTDEINSASDNPLIGDGDELANGGNFYGGYLSQGMDYLKISLGHLADLMDRQVAYIVDEKSNRGLPANLAAWNSLNADERHLHHGLKGLHQSTSAITSEILARATPGGLFSRSSESHNQDKVSLGMSAAVQCSEMLEPLFTVASMQSVILAQALDLREVTLQGETSKRAFAEIRQHVPFVAKDQPLGAALASLRTALKSRALEPGEGSSL